MKTACLCAVAFVLVVTSWAFAVSVDRDLAACFFWRVTDFAKPDEWLRPEVIGERKQTDRRRFVQNGSLVDVSQGPVVVFAP